MSVKTKKNIQFNGTPCESYCEVFKPSIEIVTAAVLTKTNRAVS